MTAPNGEAISLRQDTGLGGPVGWKKTRMEPGTMQWVNGLPLAMGDESLEQDVETAICADPGQTCTVKFVLPNFAEADGPPLMTGELRFVITDAAATGDTPRY